MRRDAEAEAFRTLSIRDLLEARSLYHAHLVGLDEHVLGTALGLKRSRRGRGGAKTFENTDIDDTAYPCIYVFVWAWRDEAEFRGDRTLLSRYIPPVLYLPDGRKVPTCVLQVTTQERAEPLAAGGFRSRVVGGGYPVFTVEQGRKHFGTLACLVTDGSETLGLTCRHVAGEPGRTVLCPFADGDRRIGVSHDSVGKRRFGEVYEGWADRHVYLNVDAGLVKLDSLADATAQVLGVRTLSPIVNVCAETLSLDLVGQPVRGFGAVSGLSTGQVDALFYRYKAIGGFEYVADVLIGPRRGDPRALRSAPGNSGQLWLLEEGALRRPLAMQWGGYQQRDEQGRPVRFVLGTFLSNVARELDVDLVRNWNTGFFEYWGAAPHQALSALLPQFVKVRKLAALLGANREHLRALAPVPDGWVRTKGRAGAEGSYHFTDMDEVAIKGPYAGKSLLELWADPANVTKDVFQKYVGGLPPPAGGNRAQPRSTLAFRAAGIYQAMVEALAQGHVAAFLAGAGVLAHYVEDASCSLHLSSWHHGDPASEEPKERNVHGDYDKVRGENLDDLVQKLQDRLDGWRASPTMKGPAEVAREVVALQRRVYDGLDPRALVRGYVQDGFKLRWAALEGPTLDAMSGTVKLLATIVESAWKSGRGDSLAEEALGEIDAEEIAALTSDPAFIPSSLDSDPGGGSSAAPRTRKTRPARRRVHA